MIKAYNELYLEKARICLGRMLDFATHDLNYSLNDFWDKFLSSNIANKLESGDVTTIVAKSGVELAYEVLNDLEQDIKPRFTENRSIEYWTGWAVAYFQWKTSIPFLEITRVIPINEIANMYHPYHEMDINQLFDKMLQIFIERKLETNLKRKRKVAGLSQKELAERSRVPLRTIQQYEQKQKNINNARAEYVLSLAKVLYCKPEELLEI